MTCFEVVFHAVSVNQTFNRPAPTSTLAAMKPDVDRQDPCFRKVSCHLGQCFRTLRKQARLSQSAVADKAGVSRCTVSDFENSKRPTVGVNYVEDMAHAVGATYMMLVSMADSASQRDAACLK